MTEIDNKKIKHFCEVCNCCVLKANKKQHEKSKKHLNGGMTFAKTVKERQAKYLSNPENRKKHLKRVSDYGKKKSRALKFCLENGIQFEFII